MEWRDDLLYEYPLTSDSIVVDVGAFDGAFTREISRRYGCFVYAFEPIKENFDKCCEALLPDRTEFFNYGWGPSNSLSTMYKAGGGSGLFRWLPTSEPTMVTIRDAREVAQELPCIPCDLLKMNIEGAEYDLLEYFLDTRLIDAIKNLLVQFHAHGAGDVGPVLRRTHIRERLLATHDCAWEFPFVWESWRRR